MILDDLPILYSVEAEMGAIGSMLISETTAEELIALLEPGEFFNPVHQEVFRAMATVQRSGRALDLVTLEAELTRIGKFRDVGGGDCLIQLAEAGSACNGSAYAEIVREKAALRRLEKLTSKALHSIHHGGTADEVAGVLGQANEHVQTGSEPRSISRIVSEMRDEEMRGVTTGHTVLDSLTGGVGYVRGQVSLLSAVSELGKSTGAGKSWYGVDAFCSALQSGKKSVYVTLADLSDEEVVRRILKLQCGMGGRPKKALDRIPEFEDGLRTLTDPFGDFADYQIYDGAKQGMDLETILNHVRRIKRKKGLEFMVLDYIQQVHVRGIPRSDRTGQLNFISKEIKLFAAQEDIAVLELSQLTISGKGDEEQVMTSYSAQVEQDAALIFELRRKALGVRWHCKKNRNGQDQVGGSAVWDERFCRFTGFQLDGPR